MKKKLLFRCAMGAPIGVTISLIITVIISLCTGRGEYYPAPHELIDWCGSQIAAVIVQLPCSLAVGAIGGGSSVIFEVENWSLTKQTLLHFAVLAIPLCIISYVMNWLPHHLFGALCYCVSFIIIYVVMWVSVFFTIKSKIKKLNQKLQQIQDGKEEGENTADLKQ